jgi:hypothetical protein
MNAIKVFCDLSNVSEVKRIHSQFLNDSEFVELQKYEDGEYVILKGSDDLFHLRANKAFKKSPLNGRGIGVTFFEPEESDNGKNKIEISFSEGEKEIFIKFKEWLHHSGIDAFADYLDNVHQEESGEGSEYRYFCPQLIPMSSDEMRIEVYRSDIDFK